MKNEPHRHTGLEICGGGGHEFAQTSRGVWGHAPQENFEK